MAKADGRGVKAEIEKMNIRKIKFASKTLVERWQEYN
jgi:hypothetical protein